MAETHFSGISDALQAIAEKTPSRTKEVVNVICELATKIDSIALYMTTDIYKVESTSKEVRDELGKIQKSMKFMSQSSRDLKNDVESFCHELTEIKLQSSETPKNQQITKGLAEVKTELIELQQYIGE